MTQNEFLALCLSRTVTPELALENDDIREALKQRDDEEVARIMDEQF